MKVYLVKRGDGLYIEDEIAEEVLCRIPDGSLLQCDITLPRNPKFHRKFLKLLRVGFKYWKPGEINTKYGAAAKRFERYRKDIIILAGFYEPVIRLDGSVRIEPASISFSNMDEVEFSELYHKALDVLVTRVFADLTEEEALRRIEEEILSFA